MRVEIRNGPSDIQIFEGTTVIVYDDFGNPIAATLERNPRMLTSIRLKDPDFEEKLQQLGVFRVVKVTEISRGQGSISI